MIAGSNYNQRLWTKADAVDPVNPGAVVTAFIFDRLERGLTLMITDGHLYCTPGNCV